MSLKTLYFLKVRMMESGTFRKSFVKRQINTWRVVSKGTQRQTLQGFCLRVYNPAVVTSLACNFRLTMFPRSVVTCNQLQPTLREGEILFFNCLTSQRAAAAVHFFGIFYCQSSCRKINGEDVNDTRSGTIIGRLMNNFQLSSGNKDPISVTLCLIT